MEDQFVPYELSVKLKELGFDAPCLGVWNIPNDEYEVTLVYGGKLHEGYINDIQSFKVCAPLWQQAWEWFLNNIKLFSYIRIFNHYDFGFSIFKVDPEKENKKELIYSSNYYDSIEEARQACLEKLIELVKDRK